MVGSLDVPQRIASYGELVDLLGEGYIILCGSAISGFRLSQDGTSQPFLPMVTDVTRSFYEILRDLIQDRGYYEQILAAYADSLVSGKHRDLRLTMKFEEFLWRFQEIVGEQSVATLLQAMYLCEPGQYGHNHVAVANLVKQKFAAFCLTTNFDNAIELATGQITTYVHPDHPEPHQLNGEPTLLKLHGDVVAGKYITTSPRLYRAEQRHEHQYLQALLKAKRILVIGYSGYGDVDIAPQLESLKNTGALLIWLVAPNSQPNPLATHWFPSDLRSGNLEKNWLLKLAGLGGRDHPIIKVAPNWKHRVEAYVGSLVATDSSTVPFFIESAFSGTFGWPFLHLFNLRQWRSHTKYQSPPTCEERLEPVFAYMQVAAYDSAQRELDDVSAMARDCAETALFKYRKGFVEWSSGKIDQALVTLIDLNSHYQENDEQISRDMALRIVLAVFHDKLASCWSVKTRRRLYDTVSCDQWIAQYLALRPRDSQEELLGRVAVLEIYCAIGQPSSLSEARQL